jgi:Fe-S oxidoreductase
MCPSFIATRDERHSVRGRANALRAAISGQLGRDGLNHPDLHEALDLCLGCKACKSECPSTVDMVKLKAEYLANYHAVNGLPFRNRVFGHIAKVNQLGRWVRPITNFLLKSRIFSPLWERALGIHRQRALPTLAPVTFEHWFHHRPQPPISANQPEVVFFHDTYTNENDPQHGQAAVEVLEAAGYHVHIVPRVCCGRPMISTGMLADAKRHAARNIEILAPFAEQGIPIVGCEPSCIAALRDEYKDFFPNDPRARAVSSQAYFIEEWIAAQAQAGQFKLTFDPQKIPPQVLYHAHCNQRALSVNDNLSQLFALLPDCEVRSSQAGCCGMAGSFGYEVEHYNLSLKIGEDRLFPTVRSASPETVIAASGTSCRHQIFDGTGRRAIHPITLIWRALKTEA